MIENIVEALTKQRQPRKVPPEIVDQMRRPPPDPQGNPLLDEHPGGMFFREDARFDDGRAFDVADLDAFKLMQLQPEYEDPTEADINATEGQNLAYLRRAMFADAAMQDPRLAKAMTRMSNNIAGRLGALGRLYTNDEFELGNLMAEQFASAILRRDSGASTPDPEVARYRRQFFPLPNETDEQLAAKAALRREEIRGLEQSLGGDAFPAVQQMRQEIQQLIDLAQMEEDQEISAEEAEFLKSLGID